MDREALIETIEAAMINGSSNEWLYMLGAALKLLKTPYARHEPGAEIPTGWYWWCHEGQDSEVIYYKAGTFWGVWDEEGEWKWRWTDATGWFEGPIPKPEEVAE